MRSVVLGLDLGTTEAKAGIFDLDGAPLGIERAAYPTDTSPDGRAEQDPADWWAAIETAVARLIATVAPAANGGGGEGRARTDGGDGRAHADRGDAVRVEAICGVAQGPTLAAVDAGGLPVRPAVTWQDRRVRDGGFGFLPRMSWLAGEDPGAVERARWLVPAWDALGLWLSGTAATSLQRHERPIDPTTLAAAGVDPDRQPPGRAMGERIGGLRPDLAERLGLAAGIPVVVGTNDGAASMLGAGLLEPGDAVDTGGASGGFGVYADRRLDVAGSFSAPAPLEGRWWVGGAMAATGASVDWLVDSVLGSRWTLDELIAEAATAPPGSEGLIFLPYLAGERAPVYDEAARGAFVGLTLAHDRRHLVRAVLEGAAYAIGHVAAPIVDAGVVVTEMRLAGGPARSDVWARIKADVTGFRVAIPSVGDTAVLGAAILAARGAGLVPDLETGVRRMTRIDRIIEPDPVVHGRYRALFDIYRSLYPALASTFAGLARVEEAVRLEDGSGVG